MKTKLTLSFLSLVIGICICEVFLRLLAVRYSHPITYEASQIEGHYFLREGSQYDSAYEYYNGKSLTRIIAVGDSYTNGGNVLREDTYPSQLYKMLGQQFTVVNQGLCESPTQSGLDRLEYFYKTDSNKQKNFVIVLIGAADIFLDTSLQENYYSLLYGSGVPVYKLNADKEERSHFYLFRLISAAWKKLQGIEIENYTSNSPDFYKIKECYTASPNKELCLKNFLEENKKKLSSSQQVKWIQSQIIYFNQKYSKESMKEIVIDLRTLISFEPKVLEFFSPAFNLIAYTNLQSFYELSESINFLRSQYKREESFINDKNKLIPRGNVYSFKNILNSLNNWEKEQEKLYTKQKYFLEKIADLIVSHGDVPLYLTYPLSYKRVNSTIREVAQKKGIVLIDLEKTFQEKKQSNPELELIDDWEHCTPLGYRMIAEEIQKKISILKEPQI